MLALIALTLVITRESPDTSKSYFIDGDRWTISVTEIQGWDSRTAVFKRNGKVVLQRSISDLNGRFIRVVRAWYPTPWPVFVVSCHTGAGHGLRTEFYSLQDKQLKLLHRTNIDNGGPVFRDFDDDGTMEWVFDDYHHYVYFDEGPEHYLIYKLNDRGSLDLWKTLRNSERTRLTMPWYRCF